jgi:hypothetical protein
VPAAPAVAASLATGSDGICCPVPVSSSSQHSPAMSQGAAASSDAQAVRGERERFQRLLQAAAASFAAGNTSDCSRTTPPGETEVSKQPDRAAAGDSALQDDQAQTSKQATLDGGTGSATGSITSSRQSLACLPAGAGNHAAVQDSACFSFRVGRQVSAVADSEQQSSCWYDVPVMQDQCG